MGKYNRVVIYSKQSEMRCHLALRGDRMRITSKGASLSIVWYPFGPIDWILVYEIKEGVL